MTYSKALVYLNSLQKYGIKLGLSNIKKLLELLKNPQQGLRVIHIAGTNGKGSTVAFISSILKEAGYKVGSYTSPHLIDFRERITINGTSIPEEKATQLVTKIKPYILRIAVDFGFGHPTFFEIVTAMALDYFFEEKVDFVVLEVGLGGRLDATNVVESLVSVIINSSYDHMDKLGSEITSIASEQAGIIKKKSLVITAARGEALTVIKKVCQRQKAKLYQVGRDIKYEFLKSDWEGQFFNAKGVLSEFKNFKIPLLGKHQLINACCAIGAAEVLKFHNIVISDENIRRGLEKTRWPGRLEIVRHSPLVILDSAHNQPAAKQLRETLREFLLSPDGEAAHCPSVPDRVPVPACARQGTMVSRYKNKERLILVIGIFKDKEIEKIVKELVPLAFKVVVTAPKTSRAILPEDLYKIVVKYNQNVIVAEEVEMAVKQALTEAKIDDIICVTGSLYTVGEARQFLVKGSSLNF